QRMSAKVENTPTVGAELRIRSAFKNARALSAGGRHCINARLGGVGKALLVVAVFTPVHNGFTIRRIGRLSVNAFPRSDSLGRSIGIVKVELLDASHRRIAPCHIEQLTSIR